MRNAEAQFGSTTIVVSDRERVRELIAALGERDAYRSLLVSRETLARVVAGLAVRRGTAALIRERLRELGAAEPGHAA